MSGNHQRFGAAGESIAADYLVGLRFKILERNYRCPGGEVDLIGLEHGTLTFIEVKTRSAEDFGSPFEAVSIAKQRRIERAAQFYLVRQRLSGKDARFDVVGVWWQDGQVRCELIRNAFEPRRWSGA